MAANFQLIIEALLRSPNVRGFAGEFDATMRRIRQQAQAGTVTPAGASKQLRESLASSEAAVTLSARAQLIGPREAVLLRRHFRQQYDQGFQELRGIFGDEITKASRTQIRGDVRRQVGRAAQGGVITPSFSTDPARNQPTLNPAVTRIQRLLAEIALTDEDYIEERARLVSALRRLRTAENEVAEALETQEIRSARAGVRAEQARNRRASQLGIDERQGIRTPSGQLRRETDWEYEDRIAAAERRQRHEATIRRSQLTDREVQLGAEAAEAQAGATRQVKERQRVIQRTNAAETDWWHRLLNRAHDRPGRTVPAESEPGPASFFTSRLLTTASYGASAAVLYSFVNSLREAGRYALELQRVTERLRAQFESLNQAGEFRGFRSALLAIARETGQAGDEVAFVGLQMKGAFGDTAVAIERTKEAIRAAQVTGLPLAEVVDSLTAASISYGSSIDDITDKAIGLEQRFGVTAQQSIKSFGDISTVAQEAGLSLNEVAGILGVIQQRSGRSLGAITEGLSRVLPAIQEKASDILLFADQQSALRSKVPDIQQDIAGGRTGQVLLTLAGAWDHLNESARKTVITLLGGRREAQYLIPLFEGSHQVLEEAARGEEDMGKAAQYQAAQQRTLGYQLHRIREEFNQLGDAFGRLGLLQGFALLAAVADKALGAVGGFARALAELNDFTGGMPGRILAIAFAIRTLTRVLSVARAATGIIAEIATGQVAGRIGQNALAQTAAQRVTSLTAGGLSGLGNGALAATGLPQLGTMIGAGAARLGFGGVAAYAGTSALAATGVGLAAAGAAVGVAKLIGEINSLNRSTRQAADSSRDRLEALRAQVQAEEAERRRDKGDGGGKGGRKGYEALDYYELNRRGFHPGAGQLARDFGGETLAKLPFVDYTSDAERFDAAKQTATAAAFKGYLDVLRDSGRGKRADELQHVLDDVTSKSQTRRDLGGLKAAEILDGLSKEERKKVLAAAKTNEAVANAVNDAGAAVVANAQELAEQYSRGQISWDTYIKSLRRQIEVLKGGGDNTRPQVLELQKQERSALKAQADQLTQFATAFAGLRGEDPILTARVQAHLTFHSPTSGPADRVQAVINYMTSLRDGLQKQVEQASSYDEAVRIASQGIETPPELINQLRRDLVKLGIPEAYIDALIQLNEETKQQALLARGQSEKLAQIDAGLGPDPTAAQQADAQRRKANVTRWFAAQKPGGLTAQDEAEYQTAVNQADKADADAAEARAEAHLNLQLANTEDPVQQARIRRAIAALKVSYANADEIDAAKAEEIAAARAERDANRAITDARLGVAEARAGSNDELLASIGQQRAAEAVERAKGAGAAAQLDAEAQRIRADRAMENYMLDAAKARRELAMAIAESLGDAAEVGRLTVEQANEDLRVVLEQQKRGEADQADVDRASANKVRAEAAEKERARNERIGDLEYLYEFDRITANELINGLTAELQTIPETNKEARREIERRIKAIRDEMGKDLSFNLPTEIKLPSLLYETRRLGAAGAFDFGNAGPQVGTGAQNYQDNRVIKFEINGSDDPDAVADAIYERLGERPRYGTYQTVYG